MKSHIFNWGKILPRSKRQCTTFFVKKKWFPGLIVFPHSSFVFSNRLKNDKSRFYCITCYFLFHLIYDHWCHFLLCSASFITIICSAFLVAILGCFISWVNNIHNKLQIVVICKCKGMLTPLQILTTPWQLLYSSCYYQV